MNDDSCRSSTAARRQHATAPFDRQLHVTCELTAFLDAWPPNLIQICMAGEVRLRTCNEFRGLRRHAHECAARKQRGQPSESYISQERASVGKRIIPLHRHMIISVAPGHPAMQSNSWTSSSETKAFNSTGRQNPFNAGLVEQSPKQIVE